MTVTDMFGQDHVAQSIQVIKDFEPIALQMHPDGYYVAFSGGKDSIVTLDLVRKAGVRHTVHFQVTTVDPPELLAYIKKHYPEVKWDKPRVSMYRLIPLEGMPPTRRARYCCKELKENGGVGRFVITGIRAEEGTARSKRKLTEPCTNKNLRYLHPMIYWDTVQVWDYIRTNRIPYCILYDQGKKRIGCIGCPNSSDRKEDFERWPRFKNMYLKAFSKMIIANNWIGRKCTWDTPEEVMSWWLEENSKAKDDCGGLFT
jgi:phosphoadenosine phosphosulfate reductase